MVISMTCGSIPTIQATLSFRTTATRQSHSMTVEVGAPQRIYPLHSCIESMETTTVQIESTEDNRTTRQCLSRAASSVAVVSQQQAGHIPPVARVLSWRLIRTIQGT